eukprot:TRINITY_DN15886_c0_g1_i1.p1 TRINITY_DN15886_c0_g1~~TRINITY_DN15886_c0_g1_i1.p1  ORF type:complete len:220 (-),score=28.15 TRINITY_DN15886_c0_g1_i1:174-833(-)
MEYEDELEEEDVTVIYALLAAIVLIGLFLILFLWDFTKWKKKFVVDGTQILLKNDTSELYLLSPNTNPNYTHPNSSLQQQVVCSKDFYDEWIISLAPPSRTSGIAKLKHGDTVHIIHKRTGFFLHSHAGHPSPISHQQEVTLWPHEDDGNNSWRLLVDGGEQGFRASFVDGIKVRFVHVLTHKYLHSLPNHSHPIFTSGNQEVSCFPQDEQYWECYLIS